MFLSNIFGNLCSDVIFLGAMIFIGWLLYRFTERDRKLKFFGIHKKRRIVIYVANIRVTKNGSIGIDGIHRSYEGSAVPSKEMICANLFREFFNLLIPSLADKPGILSKLLISDVKVDVSKSPLPESGIESWDSFITLGSPAYNAVSKYLQDNHKSKITYIFGVETEPNNLNSALQDPHHADRKNDGEYTGGTVNTVSFRQDDSGIAGPSGPAIYNGTNYAGPTGSISANKGDSGVAGSSRLVVSDGIESKSSKVIIQGYPPFENINYGYIERLYDADTGRNIFYVSGLSENTTAGAAYHLISSWKELEESYGKEKPFIRIISVDPYDFRKSIKV